MVPPSLSLRYFLQGTVSLATGRSSDGTIDAPVIHNLVYLGEVAHNTVERLSVAADEDTL
jgi:hypothetical protein